MPILLDVNGIKYTNFTSINVSRDIETLSGSFSFEATADKTSIFPIKRNSEAKIYVNDVLVLTGIIEHLSGSYDSSSHIINLSGRDKTRDIIDSTLTTNIEFKSKIGLLNVITQSLSKESITGFSIINEAGTIDDFEKHELVSGGIGDNLFSFIEGYCRKRQVLIGCNANGDIVLRRAGTKKTGVKLQNLKNNNKNNIERMSFSYDDSQRFNTIKVFSQGNPSIDSKTTNKNKLTNTNQVSTDSEINSNRKLGLIAENSTDVKGCKKRADWEVNIRRARALDYNITVSNFNYGSFSEIWEINTLVNVEDEIADINSQMLIKSIDFSYNESSGSSTSLNLVTPDAYTLSAEMDAYTSRTNKIGNNLQ